MWTVCPENFFIFNFSPDHVRRICNRSSFDAVEVHSWCFVAVPTKVSTPTTTTISAWRQP